jgi:BASS family bile acid:Na+ symporter
MVAVMPGGALSKFFTYLGRGNPALSVTLTAAGTLASLVTVPLFLRLLAAEHIAGIDMPAGRMVLELFLYLLLPLGVGMVVARQAPGRAPIFSRWCFRLGLAFVALMVVGSLGSGRIHPGDYGWRAPLAIIAFCLLAQQVSMLPFRLRGWPRADCLSVGIEATMRNLNLALLLKQLLFPAAQGQNAIGDGVLFTILFYAPVAMGCGLPLALRFRRMARREERARAPARTV